MIPARTGTPEGATPCALVAAASSLHESQEVGRLVDAYLVALAGLGGKPWAAGGARPPGPLVVFVATGGTERHILERARPDPADPVLLVAHPGHNSLPAALEVLARLQQLGARGRIQYLRGPEDREGLAELAAAIRDCAVRRALAATRIGLVGEPSDWLVASRPSADVVREVWGPTLVPLALPSSPAPDAGAEASARALARDLRERAAALVEPAEADLVAAGRVYAVLRALVEAERLDAVTVRCFDLVTGWRTTGCLALAQLNDEGVMAGCEGDVVATVAMLWLHLLLGTTPWMANPSRVDLETGTLTLAHCTVPRRAAGAYHLRSHFESGRGAAIQGALAPGPVTLVRLGGERMERLWAVDGKLTGNPEHAELCHTQAEVELGRGAVADLLARPLGNHVVLVPGHHAAALTRWHAALIG